MDFIGDLLHQMSSAFNQETAIPKKEEISMDETLKWRSLKNNQFAARPRPPQQQQQQQVGSAAPGRVGGSPRRGGSANGTRRGHGQRRRRSGGSHKNVHSDVSAAIARVENSDVEPNNAPHIIVENEIVDNEIAENDVVEEGVDEDGVEAIDSEANVVDVEVNNVEGNVAAEGSHDQDGSRSSAVQLGDNGSATPEAPRGSDIEIEIAKDISGEELQEVLGLSQMVDVDPDEENGGESTEVAEQTEPIAAPSDVLEGPPECKSSPTMEQDPDVREATVSGECKPSEEEMDVKSVPYCSSASVTPTSLAQDMGLSSDQLLFPVKCDTDDVDQLRGGDDQAPGTLTDVNDAEPLADESVDPSDLPPPQVENVIAEAAKAEFVPDRGMSQDDGNTAMPVDDHGERSDDEDAFTGDNPAMEEDDEDDVLIINTDDADEVVELAETSKEEDEDEEENEEAEADAGDALEQNAHRGDEKCNEEGVAPAEALVQAAIPFGNVTDALEEKYLPEGSEAKPDGCVPDVAESVGSSEEVKFAETLKGSAMAKSSVEDEKENEKAESALVGKEEEAAVATGASLSAGRTTRSRKAATTVATSPPVAAAAVTHSQRRSQRFQKDSSVVTPDENASEPLEEDTGEGSSAKRASSVKSDRSLRSKQPAGAAERTRRASETVKVVPAATEDSNDSVDVDKSNGSRRGRKRLSQDRVVASASLDAGSRTREKSVREESVGNDVAVGEQRRPSRSGTSQERTPDGEPGGPVQQPQQQNPPASQRRGRKRKNPIQTDAGATTSGTSGVASVEKSPPYKRAARMSRDGSDGILASALARRDKVDSQGRLSRPIKLSAKILANEELRQGFEQHNNGRIIISSEPPLTVSAQHGDEPGDRDRDEDLPEKSRRPPGRDLGAGLSVASCSTIGSSSEDVTLVSVTLPGPKVAKGGVASAQETGFRDVLPGERQPSRKPSEATAGRTVASRRPAPKAPVVPDVRVFLQEVRSMRPGSNRSPEDNRKMNRRQVKKLGRKKEKFLTGLGLQRRGAHQHRAGGPDGKDTDVELSAGESESSGSEADFVPPQKIGTVGKPSVTLRLRKPETLLEHPPPARGRKQPAPLVTIPGGLAVARPSAGPSRQGGGGKPANANVRRTPAAVVLPAAMTTVSARPSGNASSIMKDKETEQLQRSLQRLGCEVTLIPTTPRADTRPGMPAASASPWPVRRAKDASGPQRARNAVAVARSPFAVEGPGTADSVLQIVLEKRPTGSTPPPSSARATARPSAKESSVTAVDKLVCLCQQQSDIFVGSTIGSGYCTGVDDIDGQQIGCCNELPNDILNMLRPSTKVSFQLLCNMHRKRLEDHGCCAVCGLFCTQGNFAMCKSAHLFHPHCAEKYTLNTPYNPTRPGEHTAPILVLKCPHCCQECPNGEIEVNIQLTDTPVMLPSRKSIVKPAKMTVAKTGNSANGEGGSSNANASFRTTVASLVPTSVKDMLSTTTRTGNSHGNGVATASGTAPGRNGPSKDVGSTSGGGLARTRFTSKDFTHAVCTKKDDARVSEIITAGFDIETRFRDFQYGTCLHVVSKCGTLAMAYLIMCRARSVHYLNIMDRELHTAMMCGVLGEKNNIVKLLLDSGADATLKGPYGMTVLHLAAKHGKHDAIRTILECVKQRLTSRELMAFVNAIDNGHWTALAWAAENRHLQTVHQLIAIGADVNICDSSNNTSLHWASMAGCADTLYPLLTKACNPNIQNALGETPLHVACRHGHANICVVLLANGASLNIRDAANQLPQDTIADQNSECANIIAANLKMRTLSMNLKVTHVICSDISNGRERYPVQVVYYTRGSNDRQHEVPKFKYITSNIQLDYRLQPDPDSRNVHICSCKDSCTSSDSECPCSERTCYTNDGRLVNDFNYQAPSSISECGDLCDCNLQLCRNRIVQHGLDVPLQMYYIPGKAWGVRTLVPIPKGTFLIEYVGELLTDEAANHRSDDSYLFDLGGGVCIDASAYGNVSRFFNHSCQPNVSPVSVSYDRHNQRFPSVALFACRDIEAQEEICFDYGEKFWMVKQRTLVCRCNTAKCRYRTVE